MPQTPQLLADPHLFRLALFSPNKKAKIPSWVYPVKKSDCHKPGQVSRMTGNAVLDPLSWSDKHQHGPQHDPDLHSSGGLTEKGKTACPRSGPLKNLGSSPQPLHFQLCQVLSPCKGGSLTETCRDWTFHEPSLQDKWEREPFYSSVAMRTGTSLFRC